MAQVMSFREYLEQRDPELLTEISRGARLAGNIVGGLGAAALGGSLLWRSMFGGGKAERPNVPDPGPKHAIVQTYHADRPGPGMMPPEPPRIPSQDSRDPKAIDKVIGSERGMVGGSERGMVGGSERGMVGGEMPEGKPVLIQKSIGGNVTATKHGDMVTIVMPLRTPLGRTKGMEIAQQRLHHYQREIEHKYGLNLTGVGIETQGNQVIANYSID